MARQKMAIKWNQQQKFQELESTDEMFCGEDWNL